MLPSVIQSLFEAMREALCTYVILDRMASLVQRGTLILAVGL